MVAVMCFLPKLGNMPVSARWVNGCAKETFANTASTAQG